MVPSLQMDNRRCRRWKPQVLHLNDVFSIDAEVMSACHLLSDIEQQCVVSLFCQVDGGFEDMAFADFFLTAFGRGDIHHLTSSGFSTFCQFDALFTRIEFRQSVIIP